MNSARASLAFCPGCGHETVGGEKPKFFECEQCGYRLYLNPTVSACPLLFRPDGALLLVRRARDPHRGKLGIPGGFVDAGESVETALKRELFEELKLQVTEWSFFGGWPNTYPYKGVTYDVLDLYFLIEAEGEMTVEVSEITGYEWRDPWTVTDDEIAFESLRAALAHWRSQQRKP
jgi:ADP-ribose pyrophosphatase YjhB (NUDIX family)